MDVRALRWSFVIGQCGVWTPVFWLPVLLFPLGCDFNSFLIMLLFQNLVKAKKTHVNVTPNFHAIPEVHRPLEGHQWISFRNPQTQTEILCCQCCHRSLKAIQGWNQKFRVGGDHFLTSLIEEAPRPLDLAGWRAPGARTLDLSCLLSCTPIHPVSDTRQICDRCSEWRANEF